MEWQPNAETMDLLRHLAIQNSLQYEGKGQAGSVIGRLMGSRADLRQHGKVISPIIAQEVAQANQLASSKGLDHLRNILEIEAPELLEKKQKSRREGLPDLPNCEGVKPILRFAPNPNGPLSFGHSRGLVINGRYAERYDGELILRFDDTDTTVKPPSLSAYEQIPIEQEWLCGFKAQRIVIASERMELYHSHAEEMIASGHCYVCTCSADDFRGHRVAMTECPCRDNNSSLNSQLWQKMNDSNGFQPGEAVVRLRTDMTLKNPALRDWPALRIQTNPHPKVGDRWRVWPLLDFQSAIEDHLQGVTHIIRGKDLMDSTRKQVLLYEKMGWDYPDTIYWGRVKIHEFGGFSTSQMKNDIAAGHFSGWDDPRLPTLGSLKRRGIQAKAIRDFWIELGLTQKDISVPLSTLYSHNTKAIDASAPRISFVRNPIQLQLEGELPEQVMLPGHPEGGIPDREIQLSGQVMIEESDSENPVRLKDLADIDSEGNVESIERSDNRPIIHWVSEGEDSQLTITSGKEIETQKGILEKNNHPIGTIVQLERIGYAIIEDDGLLMTHE